MDPATIPPTPSMMGFLPLIILSISISVIGYFLAKQKDRNYVVWVILGLIPLINWIAVLYFIGATNLKLERKIDSLLAKSN